MMMMMMMENGFERLGASAVHWGYELDHLKSFPLPSPTVMMESEVQTPGDCTSLKGMNDEEG